MKRIGINIIISLAVNIAVLIAWFLVKDRYEFHSPEAFYLLLMIPLLSIWFVLKESRTYTSVTLSTVKQFASNLGSPISYLRYSTYVLRMAALAFLIVALARPQSDLSWQDVSTEGIDIMIALDVSASMLAKDFEPNRLESSKEVAIEFIKERRNDRIGLVIYEGESFTQSPLTTDHRVLTNLFKDIRSGMVQGGTAIGMGLATAVNRLRNSDAKSKVIILLTDGDNNAGSIAPITAAEIAREYGIRVYTIGVGSMGKALSPLYLYPDGSYKYEYVDVKIDEETMQEIADITGGEYFRATDGRTLANIYKEIDILEKTKINVTEYSRKSEEFFWFALIGTALLLLEFLLKNTIFRTLP